MQISTGIDCVLLDRIEKALEKPGFVDRILTPYEKKDKITASYLAGRWAAKEALYKALSPFGILSESWHDVSILSNEKGAPYIRFEKDLGLNNYQISVSIAHEKTFAVASVVVLKTS